MNTNKLVIDKRIVDAWPYDFNLYDHVICAAYIGSKSHGTYVPSSDPDSIDDVDIFYIVVPPVNHTIGLQKWEHWELKKDELDVVMFSLDKFMRLLLKGNPNVLGLLWLREEDYIYKHPAFQKMIAARSIFSSKQSYNSFIGYAHDQLKRLSHIAFKGYLGAKRKALVEKFGYDTKNAAHLIRLLRMGIEFLQTGKLNVFREKDAEEIKSIKKGEWGVGQVEKEAEKLFKVAHDAKVESKLLDDPDKDKAQDLLIRTTYNVWKDNGELRFL